MTVAINVTREKLDEPFYAPTFRVEIGPPGPQPSSFSRVVDVTRVTYKDGLSQLDSFELTLNSFTWGSTDVRYAQRLSGAGDAATSPLSILPGSWARLWLGYQTAMGLFPMLTGRITSVTPTFVGDGGTTMTVRVLSSLEALRETPRKFVWRSEQKNGLIKDSEIVRRIAARYQPPVTAVIPRGIGPIESGESTVTQANQTDIAFLIDRAKKRGYIVCFRESLPPRPAGETGPRGAAGNPRKFLYFGPSNMLQQQELVQMGDRDDRFELRWGASLLDFKPTLNVSSNLWSKVSVDFWNRRTRQKPKIALTLDELWQSEPGLNQDLQPLLRPLIDTKVLSEHPLTSTPVRTEGEARDLVRNTLRDNILQLVTAEGSTVGHPELRACCRVEVTGIGVLSGTYFLTGTTHTFDDSGYRTQFTARREQTK
jgi:hypothetical protein